MQATSSSYISVAVRIDPGSINSPAELMKLGNSRSGSDLAPLSADRRMLTKLAFHSIASQLSGDSILSSEFEVPVLLRNRHATFVARVGGKLLSCPMDPCLHRRNRDIESVSQFLH